MKTAKELLLAYLKEKDKLIYERTKLHYCNKEDLKEIESWTEKRCKHILSVLSISRDRMSCPWCILFRCSQCEYAKRHGRCQSDEENLYDNIRKAGDCYALIDIFGLDKLIEKYSQKEN